MFLRREQNRFWCDQAVLALTLADEGKFDEAIKIVREKNRGASPGDRGGTFRLAAHLTARREEAEKLLREAVRIRTENMPATHFLRATANGALGEFLTAQERFPEAETCLLASQVGPSKSQAANRPRTQLALRRLVRLY